MFLYRIEGDWQKLKIEAKKKWGQLTDEELGRIDGSTDLLAGAIQKHYGYTFREAMCEVSIWHRDTMS